MYDILNVLLSTADSGIYEVVYLPGALIKQYAVDPRTVLEIRVRVFFEIRVDIEGIFFSFRGFFSNSVKAVFLALNSMRRLDPNLGSNALSVL